MLAKKLLLIGSIFSGVFSHGVTKADANTTQAVHIQVKQYALPDGSEKGHDFDEIISVEKLPSKDVINSNYVLIQGKPIEIENSVEQGYIASSVSGKITPGTIKTGFFMKTLPVVNNDTIVMRNKITLSKLDNLDEFTSGVNTVQLPEITTAEAEYSFDPQKEKVSERLIKSGNEAIIVTETTP